MLEGKTTLIFDMDGTLIDSIGMWNKTDIRLIEKIKKPGIEMSDNFQEIRDEKLRSFHTDVNPYMCYAGYLKEAYQSEYTVEEIYRMRYDIAHRMQITDIDYKPDADVFIRWAKAQGYRLVVASASRKSSLRIYDTENEQMMRKAKLSDYFERIYGKDDVVEMKPNPAIYLKVMEDLGVTPEVCLVFEDSLIGVEAAKRAGIEVVAVEDSYSISDREEISAMADAYIEHWSEMLDCHM